LNLGDCYNGSGGAGGDYNEGGLKEGQPKYKGRNVGSLKPKDLVGIPWHVAFALQSNGWYLRSDVIWNKKNPMPEPVRDRPTKSHEYIFLFTKSRSYYYDNISISEPAEWTRDRIEKSLFNMDTLEPKKANKRTGQTEDGHSGAISKNGKVRAQMNEGSPFRNKRSVWTVSTKPYKGAHYATFPTDLIEPCIKAGSKKEDIVFDPFVGSGTTLLVARYLGRHGIGTDISFSYLTEQAQKRLLLNKLKRWNVV
jgi:DNA modification methylase